MKNHLLIPHIIAAIAIITISSGEAYAQKIKIQRVLGNQTEILIVNEPISDSLYTPLLLEEGNITLESANGMKLPISAQQSDIKAKLDAMYGLPTAYYDYLYEPDDFQCKMFKYEDSYVVTYNEQVFLFKFDKPGLIARINGIPLEVEQPISILESQFPGYRKAIINSAVIADIKSPNELHDGFSINIIFDPETGLITQIRIFGIT